MLLSASKASKFFGVSASTLRRWNKEGKIHASRLPSGQRVYNVESMLASSTPPLSWRPKMNVSFIRESPARNRKILKGRNSTSSHNSQTITSSLISAPALTSRGLDCVPYWNDQVADWSRRLWLPTETGSAGSPSTSSNSPSNDNSTDECYFGISSPLTPSSSADPKESDLLFFIGKYYLFTLSFT